MLKKENEINFLPVWLPENYQLEGNAEPSKTIRLFDVVAKDKQKLEKALKELENIKSHIILNKYYASYPEKYEQYPTSRGICIEDWYDDGNRTELDEVLISYNPLSPAYQFLIGTKERHEIDNYNLERLVLTTLPEWITRNHDYEAEKQKKQRLNELSNLITMLEQSNLSKEDIKKILKQIQPNLTYFSTEIFPNIEFVRNEAVSHIISKPPSIQFLSCKSI